MPRISPDQLPTPFTPAPPPEWPPAPAWPPAPPAHAAPPVMVALQRQGPSGGGRPRRSVAVLALSGLAVVALGALGAWAIGGDDGDRRSDLVERDDDRDETDTTDGTDDTSVFDDDDGADDGADGGSTLSGAELDTAYSTLFGVVGSPATLACVATQMAGNDDALRLAQMAALSVAEAQSGFTPFVACAPDADFLALIVPATVEVLGGGADANCIGSIYLTFGIDGRAEARALAYADQQQFIERLHITFGQCVA